MTKVEAIKALRDIHDSRNEAREQAVKVLLEFLKDKFPELVIAYWECEKRNMRSLR